MSSAWDNRSWARAVVETLVRHRVTFFAVCPGSRNSALALCIGRKRGLTQAVHWDERAAAFLALGHAKATGLPAAVVVTSGTAVANLHPAFLEARAAGIPLVAISADRPAELQGIGANQTADQFEIFGARGFLAIPPIDNPSMPAWGLHRMDEALSRSARDRQPLHLNLAFREPLVDGQWDSPEPPLPAVAVVHRHPETSGADPARGAAFLRQELAGKRVLVAVGECATAHMSRGAGEIARVLGAPVYADILSGLRGDGRLRHVRRLDRMAHGGSATLATSFDAVLHLGGRFVSKPFETFLAQKKHLHVHVSEEDLPVDGGLSVTHRLVAPFGALAKALEPLPGVFSKDEYHLLFELDRLIGQTTTAHLHAARPVEMSLPYLVGDLVPENGLVFAGNSMPVRDFSALGHHWPKPCRVLANRGVSGIDGVLATAVGAALATGAPTLAVLGDLTLLHDLTSLALVRHAPSAFILVAVNNGGGGIFHFLPAAKAGEGFESHVALAHGFNFAGATAQFGLAYQVVETLEEARAAMEDGLAKGAHLLVEVKSNREANLAAHRDLDEAVKQTVNRFEPGASIP